MPVDPFALQLVNLLGFGGFVVWLSWHTQTRIIPKMLDTFRSEVTAERERGDRQVADERRQSDLQLAQILTTHRECSRELAAAIEKLVNAGVGPASRVYPATDFKLTGAEDAGKPG